MIGPLPESLPTTIGIPVRCSAARPRRAFATASAMAESLKL
jgi:hypothetical protein